MVKTVFLPSNRYKNGCGERESRALEAPLHYMEKNSNKQTMAIKVKRGREEEKFNKYT